jgi:F0F1-type ATP synthase membrane subunit b/b'
LSKPAASSDTAVTGVETLRESAKWLIGAYAAVGAAMIAGLQLTSLGKIEDHTRFWVAVLTAGAALAAVVVGIYVVSKVLAPAEVKDNDLDAAERRVREDRSVLKGRAKTARELKEKYQQALDESEEDRKAISAPTVHDGEKQTAKERLAAAEKEVVTLLEPLEAIRRRLVFENVQRRYSEAKRVLAVVAGVVVASVIAFAWAANPSEESQTAAKISAHGPSLEVPSRVVVSVSKVRPSLAALRKRLGVGCKLDEVQALVVGGTASSPEIVTLPEGHCNVQRFTASQNIGIVLTAKSG